MQRAFRKVARLVVPILLPAFVSMTVGCSAGPTDGSSENTASSSAAIYDGETLLRGIYFGTGVVADQLPEIWGAQAQKPQAVLTAEQSASRLEAAAKQLRAANYPAQAQRLEALAAQVRAGSISPQDVARLTSTDYGASQRTSPEAIANQDRIVATIKSLDAGFFARFAAAIQSGDQVRVSAALEEGSKILMRASETVNTLNAAGQKRTKVVCETCDTGGGTPTGGGGDFIAGPIATGVAIAAILVVVVVAFVWLGSPDETGTSLERDSAIDLITHRFAS